MSHGSVGWQLPFCSPVHPNASFLFPSLSLSPPRPPSPDIYVDRPVTGSYQQRWAHPGTNLCASQHNPLQCRNPIGMRAAKAAGRPANFGGGKRTALFVVCVCNTIDISDRRPPTSLSLLDPRQTSVGSERARGGLWGSISITGGRREPVGGLEPRFGDRGSVCKQRGDTFVDHGRRARSDGRGRTKSWT